MADHKKFNLIYEILLVDDGDGDLTEGSVKIKSKKKLSDPDRARTPEEVKAYKKTRYKSDMGPLDYDMWADSGAVGLFEFKCPPGWEFQDPPFRFRDNSTGLYKVEETKTNKASFSARALSGGTEKHEYDILVVTKNGTKHTVDPIVRNGTQIP